MSSLQVYQMSTHWTVMSGWLYCCARKVTLVIMDTIIVVFTYLLLVHGVYTIVQFAGWCIMALIKAQNQGLSGLKLQCILTATFSSFCFYHAWESVNYPHLGTRQFCLDKSCIFCKLFLLFLNLSTTQQCNNTQSPHQKTLQCVSKKTSPTFLAVTLKSIVGFS